MRIPFAPVRALRRSCRHSAHGLEKAEEVYARHCEHHRCTMAISDKNPCNIFER